MKPLPHKLQASFDALLAAHGLLEHEATPTVKIRWLLNELNSRSGMNWKTFRAYLTNLAALGPTDEEQRNEQALILDGFAEHLRNSPLFKPHRPQWAMPPGVFKNFILTFKGTSRVRGWAQCRSRTQLKLCWSSGVRIIEQLAMKRHWLERRKSDYLLTVHSELPWVRRRIAIAQLSDPSTCAVRELDCWLERIPDDPDGPLFPLRVHGQISPEPFDRSELASAMKFRLAQLGFPQYCYTSIRVAFFKRAREQLGEAAAFYLSGTQELKAFRALMRSEADFIRLPLSPDGEDLA